VCTGDLLHSWAQSANISRAVFAPLDGPNAWIDTANATSAIYDWTTIRNCQNFLGNGSNTGAGSPPFFLYCSVVNPHPPYTSNATWEAFVDRASLTDSLTATKLTYGVRQHPADAFASASEGVPLEWNEAVAHDMALAYHGQIAEVDDMLGRVLAALDESGARERTFVVFTSDHGEMHLEHRLVEKMSMYEASARVPLIIAGPGVPRGVTSHTFVSLVDLLPTFIDMAGAAALRDAQLDGYSLAPLLNISSRPGPTPKARPPHVVVEFAGDCANGPQFMLRSGHMKLIQYGRQPPFIDATPQLFNVTADPYELVNVAGLAEYQPELESLDQALRAEVDYPTVSREILAENHGHVARWVAALPNQWENLLRQAYLDFDADDMVKFKTWLASGTRRAP
jgi:arylsulfatase K